ncbi:ornithine carbamoyltransferase [Rhizobium sullae]|uniref:ornithine carbamoyltransferase n=1 Tax=Rhizobium sullae TaxID=50338 RepID=UPI001052B3F6|nr:ornithine carbamoyltransferase [Rhizobium sullae]
MPVTTKKNFLEFHQLSPDVVESIIDRANLLASAWDDRRMPQSLQGKRVALVVDDSGWRNTTAFDLGVQAMGGICVDVPISFNSREAITDLAGYLDNWFDILVVRTKELSTLRELSANAEAPVVNARTRSNHPCETLGDLAYVKAKRGTLDDLKVVGVGPDANIFRSWVEASISLPIQVVQVYPEKWHVRDPALLNANFSVSSDMKEVLDADVIITDSWPTGVTSTELTDFQISRSVLDTIRRDVIFLPCPPVARGQEVTDDAMRHPTCQSRAAKAFLLHAQNALLEWIIA